MDVVTIVEQRVDIKSVSVHAKIGDRGKYDFKTPTGTTIKSLSDEYVPDIFPGDHYGDYLILDIDIESGQILNWKKPSAESLQELLSEKEED